jgi:hypothetical protein
MSRFLALACQQILSTAWHAGDLSGTGVWPPIVLPVKGADDEWHIAHTLVDGREHMTDSSCRYEMPKHNTSTHDRTPMHAPSVFFEIGKISRNIFEGMTRAQLVGSFQERIILADIS